jgi:hypothetical protein
MMETIKSANKGMQQFESEYIVPEQTAVVFKPTRSQLKADLGEIRAFSVKEIE